MKSWKHFKEDVQSYAKDKAAYEKATSAKSKLQARRNAARRDAQDAEDFTQRMKDKSEEDKRYGEQMYSHAKEKASADKAKSEQERERRKASNRKYGRVFDKTVKGATRAVKKTADMIRNRIRNRQNSN